MQGRRQSREALMPRQNWNAALASRLFKPDEPWAANSNAQVGRTARHRAQLQNGLRPGQAPESQLEAGLVRAAFQRKKGRTEDKM